MAIATQTPGFNDGVIEAQRTFRAVLEALACPGQIQSLPGGLQPPGGLSPALGAVALTLFDLDVQVWLQPGLPQASRDWLAFHSGCRFTEQPQGADFAVIVAPEAMPSLNDFSAGTPEYPEASTTVLLQLPSLTAGPMVRLQGPGIETTIPVSAPVPPGFWPQWQANHRHYPQGVDVLLAAGNQLLGLPRSVRN